MARSSIRRLGLVLGVALVAACGTTTPTRAPSGPTGSPAGSPSATGTTLESPTDHPTTAPTTAVPTEVPTASPSAAADCVSRTLTSLTEAQRVGQLFMIGLIDDRLDATERAAIRDAHLGSMLFTATTTVGVDGLRDVTDAVQALATDETTGGIGFLIAANQEGGRIQALRGAGLQRIPSAVEQGKLSPATLQAAASRWGRELRAAGVNVDLAPVADVVPAGTEAGNAPIGQLDREFGSDPASVAEHVAAFIRGMAAAGVSTSAKHFPGLGRVVGNTDFTADVVDDVTTRGDSYLRPFGAAIDAHAPFVMVSLATYERLDADHLAVFSPPILHGILHDDLGFRGVVISDSLGATAVGDVPVATRALDFIGAGGDMIVINPSAPAVTMAKALVERAAGDATFRHRIDDATFRVLRAKDQLGLLPCS
jgi:beta-N-acetylhexosaminidase